VGEYDRFGNPVAKPYVWRRAEREAELLRVRQVLAQVAEARRRAALVAEARRRAARDPGSRTVAAGRAARQLRKGGWWLTVTPPQRSSRRG
jgi:hypothetical protein